MNNNKPKRGYRIRAVLLAVSGYQPLNTLAEQHKNSQLSTLISQLPSLAPGELERWLISAVAVAGIVLIAMKLLVRKPPLESEFVTKEEFRQFRTVVEATLVGLRDRIDSRHLGVIESIEQLKASLLSEGERRAASLHRRLNDMEAGLARVDERTKKN